MSASSGNLLVLRRRRRRRQRHAVGMIEEAMRCIASREYRRAFLCRGMLRGEFTSFQTVRAARWTMRTVPGASLGLRRKIARQRDDRSSRVPSRRAPHGMIGEREDHAGTLAQAVLQEGMRWCPRGRQDTTRHRLTIAAPLRQRRVYVAHPSAIWHGQPPLPQPSQFTKRWDAAGWLAGASISRGSTPSRDAYVYLPERTFHIDHSRDIDRTVQRWVGRCRHEGINHDRKSMSKRRKPRSARPRKTSRGGRGESAASSRSASD